MLCAEARPSKLKEPTNSDLRNNITAVGRRIVCAMRFRGQTGKPGVAGRRAEMARAWTRKRRTDDERDVKMLPSSMKVCIPLSINPQSLHTDDLQSCRFPDIDNIW